MLVTNAAHIVFCIAWHKLSYYDIYVVKFKKFKHYRFRVHDG